MNLKRLLKTNWEAIAGIAAAVSVIVLKFLGLVHEETMLTLAVVLLAVLFCVSYAGNRCSISLQMISLKYRQVSCS